MGWIMKSLPYVLVTLTWLSYGLNQDAPYLVSGVDQIKSYETYRACKAFITISMLINIVAAISLILKKAMLSKVLLLVTLLTNSMMICLVFYVNSIDNLDMYPHIYEERMLANVLTFSVSLFLLVRVKFYLKGKAS